MEVFNKCRICRQTINHEPIKMTRLLTKFIELDLHMKNVGRQWKNTKQNICAACFNKLGEFQDFLQELQDADAFWNAQFAKEVDGKNEDRHNKHLDDVEVPQVTSTKEMLVDDEGKETEQDEEEEQQQAGELLSSGHTPTHDNTAPPSPIEDANLENFDEWTGDVDPVMVLESNSPKEKYVADQEVIEFEYELQQESSVVEGEEFESKASIIIVEEEGIQTERHSFAYEEIDGDESCDNLIQESFHDATNTAANETSEDLETVDNTYIVITTLDDNGKLKKSYQCQHCERSFDRIYDIESHYNIHSDIKPFKCNECGRSFRQKNILTTHQALHFGKKVACPECGKKFARRSQLILHFRMHRDEKPFVCEFEGCEAAFRQRQHLIDHSFIHSGEKNFQCLSCSKAFHTRKRLQDHMYKVHSYHRYGCDMCEKAFLKPHMLKNHLSHAHKVEVNDVSHLKTTIDQIKPPKRSKPTV